MKRAFPLLAAGVALVAYGVGSDPLAGGDTRPLLHSLEQGQWVQPPHALARVPLQVGAWLGSLVGLDVLRASSAVCAASAGLTAGLLAAGVMRRGAPGWLGLALALVWTFASTPWRSGTSLEYHAVPGALVLLGLWLLHRPSATRRALALGVVAGLLPLVHLLYLAAVPGLLVGAVTTPGTTRRRAGVALGTAAGVVLGVHAVLRLVAPAQLGTLSAVWPMALTQLPLQQARVQLPPNAPVAAEWFHTLGRAWLGGPPWVVEALAAVSLLAVGAGLVVTLVRWSRRRPGDLAPPLVALGIWAAGVYIEPVNYEYHLVPMAVVMLEAARWVRHLPARTSAGRSRGYQSP